MRNDLITQQIPANVGEPLLVGACFSNAKYLITLGKTIDVSWLQDPMYGSMYDNMFIFLQENGKLPSKETTISMLGMEYSGSDLENAIQKFDNAISTTKNVDIDYLEKVVKSYVIQRGHWAYFVEGAKKLSDSLEIQRLGMKMSELTNLTFDTEIGLDYWNDLDEHLIEIKKDFERIPTGYPCYDSSLGGGLYKDARCLALFMGQVHMGKSLFLGNIASRQVKGGYFSGLVSLEMDEHVYGKRFDAMFSGMDIRNLKHDTDRLKERLLEAKGRSGNGQLIIKEFGEGTLSPQALGQYIETVERKYGRKLDCLFVDYINLMIPNQGSDLRSDNSYGIIGAIARQLRNLSRMYKLPIVTATQANRGGFGNTALDMQHVSESIDLPGITDVMWSIYRDDEDKANNIIRTRYLKDRLGGKQGKEDTFNFDTSTLEVLECREAQQANLEFAVENKLYNKLEKSASRMPKASTLPENDYEDEIKTETM